MLVHPVFVWIWYNFGFWKRAPMQDRELYQEIPGLKSPWSVSQVALDLEQEQVDVFVEHPTGTKFCCPECCKSFPCYDHTPERQWRHPDTFQLRTILHASIP